MHQHLQAGDHAALAECARNMWAAASTVGAQDAATLAHRLGLAAQPDTSDLAANLCVELRISLDAYCTALAATFDCGPPRRM